MKFKPAPAKNTKVWTSTTTYKGQKILAAYMADGTLVASTILGNRAPASITAIWQRQWPHLSWQTGKAPIAANINSAAPAGTEFQRAVWAKTATIRAGNVLTYNDIAKALGKPRAARAVGSALGKNPIVPFVPCHRVVATNGALGGYSGAGGLATKRKLLAAENVTLK